MTLHYVLLIIFIHSILGSEYSCDNATNIVQVGQMRSASTFQWYMLCSVLRTCAQRSSPIKTVRCNDPPIQKVGNYDYNLWKWHEANWVRSGAPKTAISFTSIKDPDWIEHRNLKRRKKTPLIAQNYKTFVTKSIYDITVEYGKVFQLTDDEINMVMAHMRDWMILRQCCGYQSSADQRLTLHGKTNLLHHKPEDVDAPRCQLYNLMEVERSFLSTRLSKIYPKGLYLSYGASGDPIIRSGICKSTNRDIQSGKDFNKKAYRGGDIGKDGHE